MDNASIYGSDLVAQLYQDAGIQLEYLPPYSPDLNPIEESFNVLKAWVKRNIHMACVFRDFGTFIAFGIREVSVAGAQGYFEDCGYC
jgi:transposase